MYSDDVRRVIYLTIAGFLIVVVSWLGLIYISSCGFTLNCYQASPLVVRTPIPTLIPVSHSESQNGGQGQAVADFEGCYVSATDLIGAWVNGGSPESEPFPFIDTAGNPCEGTYAQDIQHLFVENNLWEPGALGCVSCHNPDLTDRSGGLDLSSYEGVMAGASGTDILGEGEWESSLLHGVLLEQGLVPEGHSPDVDPLAPVMLYAGQQAEASAGATPTATP